MWVTPFEEMTSAVSIMADPLIIRVPFTRVNLSVFPSVVVRISPSVRSLDLYLPATT